MQTQKLLTLRGLPDVKHLLSALESFPTWCLEVMTNLATYPNLPAWLKSGHRFVGANIPILSPVTEKSLLFGHIRVLTDMEGFQSCGLVLDVPFARHVEIVDVLG